MILLCYYMCVVQCTGKTECSLELLEPTIGTTLLMYFPPEYISQESKTQEEISYQLDSNILFHQLKKEKSKVNSGKTADSNTASSASASDASDDTGFRYEYKVAVCCVFV